MKQTYGKLLMVPAMVGVLALGACQTTQPGNGHPRGTISDNTMGAVLGGAAGGFLGSQFGEGSGKTVAAIAGALIGAWAGQQIVSGMTQQDQAQYQQAATQASTAPIGEKIVWYNPESGNSGSITPTRNGQTTDGRYCREYQQTVTIGGKTEQAYGTACRQPDGSWEIVK